MVCKAENICCLALYKKFADPAGDGKKVRPVYEGSFILY